MIKSTSLLSFLLGSSLFACSAQAPTRDAEDGDNASGDGDGDGDDASGGAPGTGGGLLNTGGGESGGTGSGGAATGGGTSSGSGCAGADIYCEDFEGGAIDVANWATIGADAAYDSTKGHSGSSSVRFDDEGNTGRFLKHTSGFPAGGTLYFRAYMNFQKATKDMSGHTGFIVGAAVDTNGNELRLGQSKPGCVAPKISSADTVESHTRNMYMSSM
jgi:hypothetical protein